MKDRKKKDSPVWQKYVGFGFAVLVGVVCGLLMPSFFDRFDTDVALENRLFFLAALLLGIYIAAFFHTIVHELGHLVFGLLTGYQFGSFRIFSVMWLMEDGKLKRKRHKIAGTSGQCLMIPPEMKDGTCPFVWYNLGGSILNVALGGVFLTLYLLFRENSLASPFLFCFAMIGFVIALMNGIPMRMGTVDNDGYNTIALWKSKEALEAFWIQLKIADQGTKGVDLKDMPSQWFTVPGDLAMKNSMVATRGVFACNRYMAEERFEEADALMEHLLNLDSGIVGLHRSLLMCDRIYIELIGLCRREVIENMLTEKQVNFMKSMKRFPTVLRTEYALAWLLENNEEKAATLREEFERVAESYPYPRDIDSDRDLIRIAEKKR